MKSDIESSAAAWVARMDNAPLSPVDQERFDSWIAEDRRHLGAYAKATAVFAHFDRAAALGPQIESMRHPQPPRSWVRRGWPLAASVVAAGLLAALFLTSRGAVELQTQSAQVRQVPLLDHSTVTLNTSTRVRVVFTDAQRTIRLLEGEALFDVARDPVRPFVVEVGDTRVRAVGTAFVVRREPAGKVRVLVKDGVVEVSRGGAAGSGPVQVAALHQVEVAEQQVSAVAAVSARALTRPLNWQDGMIHLDGMSLREAAAEFAHYGPVRIVIEDPELASRTITGRFSVNDPVGFARAVASSFDAQADVRGSEVRLHR